MQANFVFRYILILQAEYQHRENSIRENGRIYMYVDNSFNHIVYM